MFVSVKFNPAHSRAYTYRHDGPDELAPGDKVLVETRDGQKAVEVFEVDLPEPDFACKPILSKVISEPEDAADA